MRKEELKILNLFDLDYTIAKDLFLKYEYPWEVLSDIGDFILLLGSTLPEDEYNRIGEDIWVHKSVVLPPSVCLTGPLIICADAQIRHCAFFRGKVIVGRNSVVGNSCELKNSILFDSVQAPHYNYIGDSILGFKSHMGAASLTSNVKSDKKDVVIHLEDEDIKTNLKKFGAIIGDYVEVGCSAVLNPGTIIGRNTNIYPLSFVRGYIPSDSILKAENIIVKKI